MVLLLLFQYYVRFNIMFQLPITQLVICLSSDMPLQPRDAILHVTPMENVWRLQLACLSVGVKMAFRAMELCAASTMY